MSRSGYVDMDNDHLAAARWRSAVRNAINGKRGQAFLRELAAVLDAMPDKKLSAYVWDEPITGMPFAPKGGEVCALGAVTRARGIDATMHDPEDSSAVDAVADELGIAPAMAREIVWLNDDAYLHRTTPEERWQHIRDWVEAHIKRDEKIE